MSIKKLISWNVNGLRAVNNKGFLDFVHIVKPDVLCLQEIKAMQEQLPDELNPIDNYFSYFNSADKKGYSGTAIYSKYEPLSVSYDLGYPEHDTEGRVITAEFLDFFLVNVYTPNVKPDLSRLTYRQEWDRDFLDHLRQLDETKPVVVCGDLNVAHNEIDLARPKQNVGNAGFTQEERQGFTNIVEAGFIDTFRMFNQNPDHYSWWSYRGGARQRNVGWRIDYFCVSESFKDQVSDAFILPEVMGSDHCPVGIHLTS